MHNDIKKFADNGNLQRLKYVFVDCLDVDPTFEKYKEDYEYAKKVPGLIEQYVELTPFRYSSDSWDEDYWVSLKKDLAKNFSDERLKHMKEVVKVVHADKLKRVLEERSSIKSSDTIHLIEHNNEGDAKTTAKRKVTSETKAHSFFPNYYLLMSVSPDILLAISGLHQQLRCL